MWMVDVMQWRIINHKDLKKEDEYQIVKLKDQHWVYGIKSQMDWIRENVKEEDVHLIGQLYSKEQLIIVAYLTMSKIQVRIDGNQYEAIGVGGVCVDRKKQHQGLGSILVYKANTIIQEKKKTGILLCKNNLIGFYERCKWEHLSFKKAIVADQKYDQEIMILHGVDMCKDITIDRYF